jgi:hypothetical protein
MPLLRIVEYVGKVRRIYLMDDATVLGGTRPPGSATHLLQGSQLIWTILGMRWSADTFPGEGRSQMSIGGALPVHFNSESTRR